MAVVTPAMVRAVIDSAVERRYSSHDGALGIRGRLATTEHTFDYAGTAVRAVNCRSALAVREQLLTREPDRWLVVVTERGEDDLGAGVLAHLVGQRLRTPDPWQAVRQRFGATAVDAQLTAHPGHGVVALGLLEVMPSGGWTPAPAGLLTRDHAFGAVARRVLGFADGPVDLVAVLGWTTRTGATSALADLRSRGGDALADAVVGWIAGSAGRAGPLVQLLLSAGRAAELVPLGLVVAFLDADTDQQQASRLALARLQHRWTGVPTSAVQALGGPASTVTATLLTDARRRPNAQRTLAAADELVLEAQAEDLVARSPLLGSGLERRLAGLAEALRADPLHGQAEVESAWTTAGQHALAETDSRLAAFRAAVRLFRWLGDQGSDRSPSASSTLAGLAHRHLVSDGWVDAAVNDAAAGADGELGSALGHVLSRVQTIRDAHDTAFATALAAEGTDGLVTLRNEGTAIYPLERVLPEVVIPLAQQTPVLLLVLDGLSVGVSVEVLDDLLDGTGSRWTERLLPNSERRAAGLAVLPSITDVSRTSLLAGDLQRGQQQTERTAYAALTTAYGLPSATLFHKKDLDTITPGFAVADRVRASIDDPDCRLVSCVLNTIDDALDRSDPAGTHWTVDLVKHLRPLLDRAREAGRTVVITSDHGHIVERRQTKSRSAGTAERPARYRPASVETADDEIVVRGERVLHEGNAATLAVSERLRYGPLKAGYHGGAAPAEVVVPLVVVVPIELAQTDGIRLAPPQEPAWWFGPQHDAVTTLTSVEAASVSVPKGLPTLFDEAPEPTASALTSVGAAVVSSSAYTAQRVIAGRVSVTDDQVARLVDDLVSSGHGRLGTQQAAQALQVPVARLTGAFEQVRKLLNVEGYPVVTRDPGTAAVLLDEHLLRDQFGLAAE